MAGMTMLATRPRIGLTPDVGPQPAPDTEYVLRRNYADAIVAAVGLSLILPNCEDTGPHEPGHRLEKLFGGCHAVPDMDLVQIDIVSAQPRQRAM